MLLRLQGLELILPKKVERNEPYAEGGLNLVLETDQGAVSLVLKHSGSAGHYYVEEEAADIPILVLED